MQLVSGPWRAPRPSRAIGLAQHRWCNVEALGALIEPFLKVVEPEANPHSSLPFRGWIHVAVAMG